MKSDKEIAESLTANIVSTALRVELTSAIAAALRQRTVDCAEAIVPLAKAWGGETVCEYHSTYAAILRVGQPAEPVSPFGERCKGKL